MYKSQALITIVGCNSIDILLGIQNWNLDKYFVNVYSIHNTLSFASLIVCAHYKFYITFLFGNAVDCVFLFEVHKVGINVLLRSFTLVIIC